MNKFQAGDRVVKVTKSHRFHPRDNYDYGEKEAPQFERGVVGITHYTEHPYPHSRYTVDWESGDSSVIGDAHLMLETVFDAWDDYADILSSSEFQIGDRVRINIGMGEVPQGSLGEVAGIYPSILYPYCVKTDIGVTYVYKESELEHVSEPDTNTLTLSEGEAAVLRRLLERIVGLSE